MDRDYYLKQLPIGPNHLVIGEVHPARAVIVSHVRGIGYVVSNLSNESCTVHRHLVLVAGWQGADLDDHVDFERLAADHDGEGVALFSTDSYEEDCGRLPLNVSDAFFEDLGGEVIWCGMA